LKAIISYADPRHGHDGRGVYAAAGWLYLGPTQRERLIVLHGRPTHARTVSSRHGTRSLVWLRQHVDAGAQHLIEDAKYKYALPLDRELAERLRPLARPYPTREQSTVQRCAAEPSGFVPFSGRSTAEGAPAMATCSLHLHEDARV
jgi:hypothetical protein